MSVQLNPFGSDSDDQKIEAARFLYIQHRGISFTANVISTRGTNVAKRLKTMVRLIQAGRELSDGNNTDTFTLDGRILPLTDP